MGPPPLKHHSAFGLIKLRYRQRDRTLVYEQKGGNQSTADEAGISLDAHVHAIHDLTLQMRAKSVLLIGCAGGTLATMLTRSGCRVTAVDIDKVAFELARRYFSLPRSVTCVISDGLTYMEKTRRRFDVVILDTFMGEIIPEHMRSGPSFGTIQKCVNPGGAVFVNVCLDGSGDMTADRIARGFKSLGLSARLLDSPGPERNAVVLAGNVLKLQRPELRLLPLVDAKLIAKDLARTRFRRLRPLKAPRKP